MGLNAHSLLFLEASDGFSFRHTESYVNEFDNLSHLLLEAAIFRSSVFLCCIGTPVFSLQSNKINTERIVISW